MHSLLGKLVTAFSVTLSGVLLVGCDTAEDESSTNRTTVQIAPTSAPGSSVNGRVTITTSGNPDSVDVLTIRGTIEGLSQGAHGMHLHANADCSAADTDDDGEPEPAGAAGPHYDREGDDSEHGAPGDAPDARHYGDFGNITADSDGTAAFEVAIERPEGVVVGNDLSGRAVVIHSGEDDLETDPGGNSGTRVGCGTS